MTRSALRAWRPGRGDWNHAAATHLLRRAGFGGTPGEATRLASGSVDAAIDELMARDTNDPRMMKGVAALLPAGSTDRLAGWWMSLILAGGAPLRERVTLMWHDHFATSDAKVDDARMMYRQNRLFREQGLGDFRELLHAVAKDPAMLVWLDGGSNKSGHPNENFAREVMELFALGIGNYTEEDIQEVARALTGWGTQGRSFRMRASDHDAGEKVIFGEQGAFGGEDAIDRILAHPACARHVARRLLEEFVSSDPDPGDVAETAAALVDNAWQIGKTIEAILRSELFFSSAARRSRIAGPVELIAMTARGLGVSIAPQTAADDAAQMGQSLFRPPTVKGWDGMRVWINAGTWVARHNAMTTIVESGVDLPAILSPGGATPTSAEGTASALVRALVPDLTGGSYASRLAHALRGEKDADERLGLGAALVLTSPEYHVV